MVCLFIDSLPPAIYITIDGQEFRGLSGQSGRNFYIFDPDEGSSIDLAVDCNFEGSSMEITQLQDNSFWKVAFDDAEIDLIVQNSPFEANLSDSVFAIEGVNVSFMADSFDSTVTFDPMLTPSLTGEFQCHSSGSGGGFSVQSPVAVNITTGVCSGCAIIMCNL